MPTLTLMSTEWLTENVVALIVALVSVLGTAATAIVSVLARGIERGRERKFRWDVAERAANRRAAAPTVIRILTILFTFETWAKNPSGEHPRLPGEILRARLVAYGHDHTVRDLDLWLERARALIGAGPNPDSKTLDNEAAARGTLVRALVGLVRGETVPGPAPPKRDGR